MVWQCFYTLDVTPKTSNHSTRRANSKRLHNVMRKTTSTYVSDTSASSSQTGLKRHGQSARSKHLRLVWQEVEQKTPRLESDWLMCEEFLRRRCSLWSTILQALEREAPKRSPSSQIRHLKQEKENVQETNEQKKQNNHFRTYTDCPRCSTWVNLMREGDPVRPNLHDYVFILKATLQKPHLEEDTSWPCMHMLVWKQALDLKPKPAALHDELKDHQQEKQAGN